MNCITVKICFYYADFCVAQNIINKIYLFSHVIIDKMVLSERMFYYVKMYNL